MGRPFPDLVFGSALGRPRAVPMVDVGSVVVDDTVEEVDDAGCGGRDRLISSVGRVERSWVGNGWRIISDGKASRDNCEGRLRARTEAGVDIARLLDGTSARWLGEDAGPANILDDRES